MDWQNPLRARRLPNLGPMLAVGLVLLAFWTPMVQAQQPPTDGMAETAQGASPAAPGLRGVGSDQTGSGQTGSGQAGSGEAGSGEAGSGEAGSGEAGSGEVVLRGSSGNSDAGGVMATPIGAGGERASDQTAADGGTGAAGGALDGTGAAAENPAASDISAADTLEPREPDLRGTADREAFEQPLAGHNPGAFQIEAVAPLADRRTRQFFENEPFAHIGWTIGGFIVFQELEVSPAWASNVFFEADARADWRAAFRSESRLVSNWSNHALEARMVQERSYHDRFTSENDAQQTYELRGRLDVTARTQIEALAAREIRQESRNAVDARGTAGGGRPDVVTDRITATLNHRFNRLSLQLRGGVSDTRYDDAGTAMSDDRDVTTRSVALRGQWEFRPTFSVFGEVELDQRRHDAVAVTDSLSRNSNGERYRAGVALGQTGEYLRGEASVGWGVLRPDAAALPDVEAFLVDATVAWRVTALTSVLLEAQTAIDETTLAGSSGVVNRRIGATLRHSFSERLIGEGGVSYATQDYQGSGLEERSLTFRGNAEYTFNRHAALFTRYECTRYRSTDAARDYDAQTVLFGARLRN